MLRVLIGAEVHHTRDVSLGINCDSRLAAAVIPRAKKFIGLPMSLQEFAPGVDVDEMAAVGHLQARRAQAVAQLDDIEASLSTESREDEVRHLLDQRLPYKFPVVLSLTCLGLYSFTCTFPLSHPVFVTAIPSTSFGFPKMGRRELKHLPIFHLCRRLAATTGVHGLCLRATWRQATFRTELHTAGDMRQ